MKPTSGGRCLSYAAGWTDCGMSVVATLASDHNETMEAADWSACHAQGVRPVGVLGFLGRAPSAGSNILCGFDGGEHTQPLRDGFSAAGLNDDS